ncbi:TPA: hypothetical protein U1B14_001185 [Streptococcus suis]|uniref:hypothetical protein n=1 Tax=Streptococcus suis TaxID=1307 RepID=UPI00209A67B6|nr:hypothetical protein [Streptococcus suis]MCO8206266.1 hypothetical protein [Streptococcus suis]MCO8210621.1 hypothetical protein [Streptococcus suis]HEM3491803.1 hypothetical protein [Streptococcus suis]HEM3492982.1 hypothetical protein [Streptococcus suis]
MKKKILAALILTFLSLLLWGIGKLYIAYNLSHYAGYYVQYMPRKEGTNPEMVIVLKYLNDIEKPTTNNLSYDFDGNGAIILDNSIVLSRGTYTRLRNYTENKKYIFNNFGSYSFYYTDDIDKKKYDSQYQKEAELLLDKILPPILEAQPKPKINLQKLFNDKYYKQFNE